LREIIEFNLPQNTLNSVAVFEILLCVVSYRLGRYVNFRHIQRIMQGKLLLDRTENLHIYLATRKFRYTHTHIYIYIYISTPLLIAQKLIQHHSKHN
jgi:hypothetical protein